MSHHSSKKFAHNLTPPPPQVDVDDVDIGVIISNDIVINLALLFSNIITILKREGRVVRNPSLGNWVTVIGMMGDRTVCCWWVTILVMVGDHPRDGWRLSLSRWVIVLGMVGDHPGDYG